MGKHNAPSKFETLLPRTRRSFGGQIIPLAVIALTGIGVSWSFNEGMQSKLDEQASQRSPFIYACGNVLCQDSVIFTPRPKVVCSDALKDSNTIINEARKNNQNTIEIASFLSSAPEKTDPQSPEALKSVDHVIAEAHKNDMRVILNLSEMVIRYSENRGQKQWREVVEPTSKHLNSETGVAYASDPTIMMINLRPQVACSDTPTVANFKLEPQITEQTKAAFPMQLVII